MNQPREIIEVDVTSPNTIYHNNSDGYSYGVTISKEGVTVITGRITVTYGWDDFHKLPTNSDPGIDPWYLLDTSQLRKRIEKEGEQ